MGSRLSKGTTLKKCLIVLICVLISSPLLFAREKGSMVLYGKVPGRYLGKTGTAGKKGYLSKVVIKDGVIKKVSEASLASARSEATRLNIPFLQLKSGSGYDIIYPGLIDLHNHNNQNVMPTWEGAKGRFANRFEWRQRDNWGYKQGVKLNMNPWYGGLSTNIGFQKIGACATARWSALQSLVLGTTLQQADIKCTKGFSIPSLKQNDVILYDDEKKKMSVASQPGDLIFPNDMPVLWQHLQGTTDFPKDFLNKIIKHYCPAVMPLIRSTYNSSKKNWPVVLQPEVLKLDFFKKSKAAKYIDKNCNSRKGLKNYKSFRSFLNNGVFAGIASKLRNFKSPKFSTFITHLSEGRRLDPYNRLELKLLKILGFAREFVNIIHGVGVDKSDYKNIMARNKMGLIWSPYSNLLLYNQTADIVSAFKAYKSTGDRKVRIALGSDWTPTGSKSVLEEVKLARNYIKKIKASSLITDEELYKMMTENSARMLNYLEKNGTDKIHGIGTIKVDAAATLIVVKQQTGSKEDYRNVYTNLVTAKAKHINLVIIHGTPLYGEIDYLKSYKENTEYEELPGYFESVNSFVTGSSSNVTSRIPLPPQGHDEKDSALFSKLLKKIFADSDFKRLTPSNAVNRCGFTKGLVHMDSLKDNNSKKGNIPFLKDLVKLRDDYNINLDRFYDLQALLGTFVTTQTRNMYETKAGKQSDRIKKFPSMFSCNDPGNYNQLLANYVSKRPGDKNDHMSLNVKAREEFRKEISRNGSKDTIPQRQAMKYDLEYDAIEGIYGY